MSEHSHPAHEVTEPSVHREHFRMFPALDQRPELARLGDRIDRRMLAYVSQDTMIGKLVAALAERRALPLKEVIESFEFVQRVRSWVRAPMVADLCCGHGLTGLLLAALEREVKSVTLLDRVCPPCHHDTLDALSEVAPWIREKVRFCEQPLSSALELLAPGTAVLAVHACGPRTDRVIDIAIELRAPIAVMPCCYRKASNQAPLCLQRELGPSMSADIHRSYRLESAGYQVSWTAVPSAITPMNRILRARSPQSTSPPLPRRNARHQSF